LTEEVAALRREIDELNNGEANIIPLYAAERAVMPESVCAAEADAQ
jgi:hypothetical protein